MESCERRSRILAAVGEIPAPTRRQLARRRAWFILSGVAGGYFLHTKHTRPWYERKKVIDTGSGPLGFPDRLA